MWLAGVAALGWLALVALLVLQERRLIFFPARALAAAPADFGLAAEELAIRTPDGVLLHGWWIEGPGDRVLIWYHGNAGNIGDRLHNARWFVDRLGVSVVLVDYRGYGRSGGTPDEAGVYADGLAVYDAVAARGGGRSGSSSSAVRSAARSRSRSRSTVRRGRSSSSRCSARCPRWPASTTRSCPGSSSAPGWTTSRRSAGSGARPRAPRRPRLHRPARPRAGAVRARGRPGPAARHRGGRAQRHLPGRGRALRRRPGATFLRETGPAGGVAARERVVAPGGPRDDPDSRARGSGSRRVPR